MEYIRTSNGRIIGDYVKEIINKDCKKFIDVEQTLVADKFVLVVLKNSNTELEFGFNTEGVEKLLKKFAINEAIQYIKHLSQRIIWRCAK